MINHRIAAERRADFFERFALRVYAEKQGTIAATIISTAANAYAAK